MVRRFRAARNGQRAVNRMPRAQNMTPEALVGLGADVLAAALVEHAGVDPILRKKLRMLMAAEKGAGNLATVLEKRIRTIGRSRSFVDWDKRKGLVQELGHLRATIVETLALEDKQKAADLMWQFLGIADSVLERTDDSGGRLDEVFGQAMEDLGRLCADLSGCDRVGIARRVLTIVDGNGFGSSGALIQHLSEALGPEGRAELRKTTETAIAALPKSSPHPDRSWQIDSRRRQLAHRLATLADLEGDVDRYTAALRQGRIETAYVAEIAERLITAGRAAEALEWLSRPTRVLDHGNTAPVDLQVRALEALGRMDDAQEVRWAYFQKTLNVEYLRAYLKRLPDFEDFEAERKAFEIAAAHRSAETALTFFVAWPDLQRADRLVRERLMELDGAAYYAVRPAAEALEDQYPAAATRLYRRMVESVLDRGASKQYPYAARDLLSCARLADHLGAEWDFEDHAEFMRRLNKQHGRKYGFWGLIKDQGA
jgi:hypothetical protein